MPLVELPLLDAEPGEKLFINPSEVRSLHSGKRFSVPKGESPIEFTRVFENVQNKSWYVALPIDEVVERLNAAEIFDKAIEYSRLASELATDVGNKIVELFFPQKFVMGEEESK